MECNDYQRLISRLHDGELASGDMTDVFLHLSACGECRDFYRGLQTLDRTMNRLAVPLPADDAVQSTTPAVTFRQQPWWNRNVALRLPVFALLVCAVAVSLLTLIPGTSFFRSPESIYVTKMPAVVVEASVSAPR